MDSRTDPNIPNISERELFAEVAKRFSEENIEDWDFRDPDIEFKDPVAGLFLIPNYPTVMAVDLARLEYIKAFLERALGELSEDKRYVLLPGANDDFWRGFTKGSFRESLPKRAASRRRCGRASSGSGGSTDA